jgi:NADH:ubiquinone oxidoreductase subunit K
MKIMLVGLVWILVKNVLMVIAALFVGIMRILMKIPNVFAIMAMDLMLLMALVNLVAVTAYYARQIIWNALLASHHMDLTLMIKFVKPV